jgi:hypothetical protein
MSRRRVFPSPKNALQVVFHLRELAAHRGFTCVVFALFNPLLHQGDRLLSRPLTPPERDGLSVWLGCHVASPERATRKPGPPRNDRLDAYQPEKEIGDGRFTLALMRIKAARHRVA